jgi:hypothetical protein
LGRVGAEVSEKQAYVAARLKTRAGSAASSAMGDPDRVGVWLRVYRMANFASGVDWQPNVINRFSDLISPNCLKGVFSEVHIRDAA